MEQQQFLSQQFWKKFIFSVSLQASQLISISSPLTVNTNLSAWQTVLFTYPYFPGLPALMENCWPRTGEFAAAAGVQPLTAARRKHLTSTYDQFSSRDWKEGYPLCSGISRFYSAWHLQLHISGWLKKSPTGSKGLQEATTTLKTKQWAQDNKEQKGFLFDNIMSWAEL